MPRAEDISITCPSHRITQVKQRTNTYKRVKTNRNNNGMSSTHHPTLTALIQLNSDDICLILWTSNLTFQHRTKLGHTSDTKNTSKEMIDMRILMPPGGCTLFYAKHTSRRKLEPATGFFSSPSLNFEENSVRPLLSGKTWHAPKKNNEENFRSGQGTYKGSIIHKGQSRKSNKCNLKHIVPAIQ